MFLISDWRWLERQPMDLRMDQKYLSNPKNREEKT